MKTILAIACALCLCGTAHAASQGGFTGPGSDRDKDLFPRPGLEQVAKPPRALPPSVVGEKPLRENRKGGFDGPVSGIQGNTVAQAISLPDDSLVVLTGHLVSRKGGTKKYYIFRDQTGEIIAEISKKRFRGQKVTPASLVRITGRVDKEEGPRVEVEVKRLEVLQ